MKPTEIQIKTIDTIVSIVKSWKNTNDINSPTLSSDIQEEIYDLLEKVRDYIHNHHSYHVWYTPSYEEEWSANNSYVTFEVYAYSDQDDGREWTEEWFVDSDGKIGNGEETYDNYDDFKLNWL